MRQKVYQPLQPIAEERARDRRKAGTQHRNSATVKRLLSVAGFGGRELPKPPQKKASSAQHVAPHPLSLSLGDDFIPMVDLAAKIESSHTGRKLTSVCTVRVWGQECRAAACRLLKGCLCVFVPGHRFGNGRAKCCSRAIFAGFKTLLDPTFSFEEL